MTEQAAILERAADWEGAHTLYARAFAAAYAGRDVAGLAEASRGGARVLCKMGRLEEAEELAELSLEIATRALLPRATAYAASELGQVVFRQGIIPEAAKLSKAALEWARESHDDELIGAACTSLGVVADIQGDPRLAFQFYLESIAAAVHSGNLYASLGAYSNLGLLASDLGEWMQADLLVQRALEVAEQEGYTHVIPLLLLIRATLLFEAGESELAREILARAEGLAERIQSIHVLALVAQFHAKLARCRGDEADAAQHLGRCVLLATRAGLRLERAEALEQLALLHHDAGHVEDAHANLAEACAEFFAAGAARDCARCRDLLAAWPPPADDAPAGTVPALRIAGAA